MLTKISGSTLIQTQGLRNTVPALYHWAIDISPNACPRLHIPPPSKLEFSPELWRQRDILKCLQMKCLQMKCLQGTEAVDNHNVLFQVGTKSNR